MPDIIRLLPDSVANKIAAGEVIQRPSSAVKELLENSIDSGASDIKLIIKDSGKTLIQVVDDGCGMSGTDARMCFERHATSKIKDADDLFKIRTMGFRGEALASIGAIAQVEIKSKRVEDELGTSINIEGSKVINQQSCSCADGTSISVKNLFYNVPARRNFLKKDQAETRHIIEEFFRVALIYHHISFSFFHNNKEIYHLNKTELKQRIVALQGTTYNQKLIPLEQKSETISIYGFIGKPENVRKTRGEQYFFANNRFIKQAYLNHAVINSYEGLIPENSFPSYFIFIEVDPATIDVNIHPTKTEVKFQDERIIYAFLKSAIKQSLGKYSISPSLDFETERSIDFPVKPPNYQATPPVIKVNPDYNPFETDKGYTKKELTDREISNKQNWEKIFENQESEQKEQAIFTPSELDTEETNNHDDSGKPKEAPEYYNTLQLQKRYILTHVASGLMIIDQRRAHIKILFEEFINLIDNNESASQQELFPVEIKLSLSDAEILRELIKDIHTLGFTISESKTEKDSFEIKGTPSGIKNPDIKGFIEEFLEHYKKNLIDFNMDKGINLAASMAENLAIRSGDTLEKEEMSNIIDQLFACGNPEMGHDGKATFRILNYETIDSWF